MPRLLPTRQKPQTKNEWATISYFISNKAQLPLAAATTFSSPKVQPLWTRGPHKLRKVQLHPEGKWLSPPRPSVNRIGRLSPPWAQMPRESMSHKKGCGSGCIINIREWSLYLCSAGAHPPTELGFRTSQPQGTHLVIYRKRSRVLSGKMGCGKRQNQRTETIMLVWAVVLVYICKVFSQILHLLLWIWPCRKGSLFQGYRLRRLRN